MTTKGALACMRESGLGYPSRVSRPRLRGKDLSELLARSTSCFDGVAVGAESDHLNRVVAPPHGSILDVVYFKYWVTVPGHVIGLTGAQRVLALTAASDQYGLAGGRRAYRLLTSSG